MKFLVILGWMLASVAIGYVSSAAEAVPVGVAVLSLLFVLSGVGKKDY